jgi:hypothetical protein
VIHKSGPTMHERQHSPKPWRLEDDELNNRVRVVCGPRKTPIISFGPRKNWDRIDEGNANMVIAAVEMFEALEPFDIDVPAGKENEVFTVSVGGWQLKAVRAAILKALGASDA